MAQGLVSTGGKVDRGRPLVVLVPLTYGRLHQRVGDTIGRHTMKDAYQKLQIRTRHGMQDIRNYMLKGPSTGKELNGLE